MTKRFFNCTCKYCGAYFQSHNSYAVTCKNPECQKEAKHERDKRYRESEKGKATKPFLLPQRNPKEYYRQLMYSYNTPDFTARPVEVNAREMGRKLESPERIPFEARQLR